MRSSLFRARAREAFTQVASYWRVSRKQIDKHIEAGTLDAIGLGPRLFRIRTSVARTFEQSARMSTASLPQAAADR